MLKLPLAYGFQVAQLLTKQATLMLPDLPQNYVDGVAEDLDASE